MKNVFIGKMESTMYYNAILSVLHLNASLLLPGQTLTPTIGPQVQQLLAHSFIPLRLIKAYQEICSQINHIQTHYATSLQL